MRSPRYLPNVTTMQAAENTLKDKPIGEFILWQAEGSHQPVQVTYSKLVIDPLRDALGQVTGYLSKIALETFFCTAEDFRSHFANDYSQLENYIKPRLATFVLFDNDLTLTKRHTWHAISQLPIKPGFERDWAHIRGKVVCPRGQAFDSALHFDPSLVTYTAFDYSTNLRFPEQTAEVMKTLAQQPGIKVGVSTRHPFAEPVNATVAALFGADQSAVLATQPYSQAAKLASMHDFSKKADAVQNGWLIVDHSNKMIAVTNFVLVDDDEGEIRTIGNILGVGGKVITVNQQDNQHLLDLNQQFKLGLNIAKTPFDSMLAQPVNAQTPLLSHVQGMQGRGFLTSTQTFSVGTPESDAEEGDEDAASPSRAASPSAAFFPPAVDARERLLNQFGRLGFDAASTSSTEESRQRMLSSAGSSTCRQSVDEKTDESLARSNGSVARTVLSKSS